MFAEGIKDVLFGQWDFVLPDGRSGRGGEKGPLAFLEELGMSGLFCWPHWLCERVFF